MSTPEAPAADEQTISKLDVDLLAQAKGLGVSYAIYKNLSHRERAALKSRRSTELREEARAHGIPETKYLGMTTREREAARAEAKHKSELPEAGEGERPSEAPEERDEERAFTVHTSMDDVPPDEAPQHRKTMTMGGIEEVATPTDFVGESPPGNLADLYERYPVGDGVHYLRVERTKPLRFRDQDVAGYLGDQYAPIDEAEFQLRYGGRQYKVILYGPDPKGRTDSNTGNIRIKALTKPIDIKVPHLEPRWILPAVEVAKQEQEGKMKDVFNPFSGIAPASQADAAIHKTNIDAIGRVMDRQAQENERLRKETTNSGPTETVLGLVASTSQQALETARHDSESREKILNDQLTAARAAAAAAQERSDRNIQALTEKIEQVQAAKPDQGDQTLKLLQATREQFTESERQRMERMYREDAKRQAEAHQSELSREKNRFEEQGEHYRRQLEEQARRATTREKELTDEITRVRTHEKEVAEDRLRDADSRAESRINDMKAAYEREMRSNRENWDLASKTEKTALDIQMANERDKAEAARLEAERLRGDLDRAQDPAQVIAKAQADAEALGFQKKDESAPEGAAERFATAAGAGVGKALETMDNWLPSLMGRGAPPGPAPRALPQGVTPQQAAALAARQAPPQQMHRRAPTAPAGPRGARSMQWGTEGSPQRRPRAQGSPPPQAAAPPQAPVTQAAPAPQPRPEQHAQPQAPDQPASVEGGSGPAGTPPQGAPPAAAKSEGFGNFSAEVVEALLTQLGEAVDTSYDPTGYGDAFVGNYPAETYGLVSGHTCDQLLEFIEKKYPSSACVRRDGREWMRTMWERMIARHQQVAQAQAQQLAQQGATEAPAGDSPTPPESPTS